MEQYEFTGTNPISPHLVSRKAGVQCVLKSDVVEHTIDGTKYNLKEILDADIKGDKVTVKIGDEEKSVQEILKDGIPETSVNKKYLEENYVDRTEFDDKYENVATLGDIEMSNFVDVDTMKDMFSNVRTLSLPTNTSCARNIVNNMKSRGYKFLYGYVAITYYSTKEESYSYIGTGSSGQPWNYSGTRIVYTGHTDFSEVDENLNRIGSASRVSTELSAINGTDGDTTAYTITMIKE